MPRVASPAETVHELLRGRGTRRNFVPLARSFLQQPRPGGGPGPLSRFVVSRRKRALDLYLLIHAVASSPPHDVTLPAKVWARALDMPPSAASAVQISKTLSWLESERLLESTRVGNLRRVVLLADDGSGRAYRHPAAEPAEFRVGYLKLSHDYWLEQWHRSLDLPATAVLLIALSLPDEFRLPQHHGAEWYGISRDTVRRGLHTLQRMGLLSYRKIGKVAPLAPSGMTVDRVYSLTGPLKVK
ncbi:MAG TPA: hypothetical protein VFT79_06035 [Solirubrobacterales bacterium]|nr:hypothetical protein [Solirubrobacterales bacterium]